MAMNQINKTKAFTVKALMNNPKTAKIIKEAFNAPVGSTKRAQLKSMLGSLNRGTPGATSMDGQGGQLDPSFGTQQPVDPNVPQGRIDAYDNPLMNRVAMSQQLQQSQPQPPATTAPPEPVVPQQQRFVESIDSFLPKESPTATGLQAGDYIDGPKWQELQGIYTPKQLESLIERDKNTQRIFWKGDSETAIKPSYIGETKSKTQDLYNSISSINKETLPIKDRRIIEDVDRQLKYLTGLSLTSKEDLDDFGQELDYMKTALGNIDAGSLSETDKAKMIDVYNQVTSMQDLLLPRIKEDSKDTMNDYDFSQKINEQAGEASGIDLNSPDAKQQIYDKMLNIVNGTLGGSDKLETWYNTMLNDQQREYYKPVYDAIKEGVGSKTFTLDIMSDKDKLSGMLGIPKEQLDLWPESGMLSEWLDDIKDTIDKGYGLDQLKNKVEKLEMRDLTITDDLKSYIRGKDEYLGKLDGLLVDARSKFAYMDTSNPNVQKRMENYVNYLTILKGRQNQRYLDYLNNSVKTHEIQLKMARDSYSNSYDKATKAFESVKAGKTEFYNNVKDIIGEMYSNAEKQMSNVEKIQDRQLDVLDTALDIVKDIGTNWSGFSGVAPEDQFEFDGRIQDAKERITNGEDQTAVINDILKDFPNVQYSKLVALLSDVSKYSQGDWYKIGHRYSVRY
jgi:hypothetical protein